VEKTISARDGRWFTVRIMPYRTMDDRINGVVITFANITVAKNLEGKLRGKHTALEKRVAEDSAERAASEAAGGKPIKAAGKAPRTRKH
jgi:two-component system CheB/CheR fusion protein